MKNELFSEPLDVLLKKNKHKIDYYIFSNNYTNNDIKDIKLDLIDTYCIEKIDIKPSESKFDYEFRDLSNSYSDYNIQTLFNCTKNLLIANVKNDDYVVLNYHGISIVDLEQTLERLEEKFEIDVQTIEPTVLENSPCINIKLEKITDVLDKELFNTVMETIEDAILKNIKYLNVGIDNYNIVIKDYIDVNCKTLESIVSQLD